MPDQIDSGERTTRTPHECAYCADIIPPGTRTPWWKIADAGSVWTGYGHTECLAADHWDAAETGRRPGEELGDVDEFRTEVLSAYREHLATKETTDVTV